MSTTTLILTIAPDRDGGTVLTVSFRHADGTQSQPIPVTPNNRLGAFVAAMQALADQQLAARAPLTAHAETVDVGVEPIRSPEKLPSW